MVSSPERDDARPLSVCACSIAVHEGGWKLERGPNGLTLAA
jgi:hypothetical protein